MIRHRGPDEFGIYHDTWAGLGSARLSIIDLSGGQQPIGNEDGTLWIVFNGEIFNYIELRPELERRGHRFTTNSDTEVVLHLYEDYGPDCLKHLNGQFAIAIWDALTAPPIPRTRSCGHPPGILYSPRRSTHLRLGDQGALGPSGGAS